LDLIIQKAKEFYSIWDSQRKQHLS
jgi:hypothetical protein